MQHVCNVCALLYKNYDIKNIKFFCCGSFTAYQWDIISHVIVFINPSALHLIFPCLVVISGAAKMAQQNTVLVMRVCHESRGLVGFCFIIHAVSTRFYMSVIFF
jgi:hypothetical protein